MQEFLSRSLNRENVIRGTLFFVLCTFAGLFLSFLWSGTQDIKQVFREMQAELLLGACLCMFADWLFGAIRFHVFVRKVTPEIKFRDSLRANLATLCVSCITPFQTGGVGHLYIYVRAGVPLSGAVTTGIICFLSTLTTLIVCAGCILWLNPPFLPKGTTLVSQYSLLVFGVVFTLFLLLLLKPDIVLRFFNWLCAVARRRFARLGTRLARATFKLEQFITEHKANTQMLIRHHKGTCALSVLLTGGFFAARILGSYVVVKALNGEATLWEVGVTGVMLNFVVMFVPSPGASGVAELTTVVLMKNLIRPELIPLYVLLTRFFTIYCAVGVGGIVIGSQLAKDFKKNKKDIAENAMPQATSRPIRKLTGKKRT